MPAKPIDLDASIQLAELRLGLPAEQDEVVRLQSEGYTLEEVAERTGMPIGTVRGRARLAKKKMKRRGEKKD
jgi:DNA-directed RNA polymerase specialized sigma24 family protein